MKKTKKIFLIIILILSLLPIFEHVLAQARNIPSLELVYPTLVRGVAPPESTRTFLPRYIIYIYTSAIALGGIISLISLLYGGFKYLTSAGNPGKMSDAKDQLIAGIIGLVVILGSYLFLNEIDPRLTEIARPFIEPARKGIIIYSDEQCGQGANGYPEARDLPAEIRYMAMESTSSGLRDPQNRSQGFPIQSFFSFNDATEISVFFYESYDCTGVPLDTPGHNPLAAAMQNKNSCVSFTSTIDNVQCVRLLYRIPGVWLFGYEWGNPLEPLEVNCGGRSCIFENYRSSSETLSSEMEGVGVASVGIVKDVRAGEHYGAILYGEEGGLMKSKGGGWAHIFLPSSDFGHDVTVYNVTNLRAKSITVFLIPNSPTNASDEFEICRNARCASEWDPENEAFVFPKLRIGWNRVGNNPELVDLAANPIGNVHARAINSNSPDALNRPNGWNDLVWRWQRILGGITLLNEDWRDENGQNFDTTVARAIDSGRVRAAKPYGVSAIYLPLNQNYGYFVLLYNNGSLDLRDLCIGSRARTNISAAAINADVADLTTLRWDDRTLSMIVIAAKKR